MVSLLRDMTWWWSWRVVNQYGVTHIYIWIYIKWYTWIYMEYNDITYSMYTLLIKWGCTPSKESNIVLVWCDSSPYHTLVSLVPGSQDLRETCADAAGRIARLRPDFAFFFQSCAPLKTAVAGFETDSCFFMFFSSLPGMKISCDVPEMGWSQKMVEGWFASTHDLCQLKPISRRIQADPLTFGGASLWSVLQ